MPFVILMMRTSFGEYIPAASSFLHFHTCRVEAAGESIFAAQPQSERRTEAGTKRRDRR